MLVFCCSSICFDQIKIELPSDACMERATCLELGKKRTVCIDYGSENPNQRQIESVKIKGKRVKVIETEIYGSSADIPILPKRIGKTTITALITFKDGSTEIVTKSFEIVEQPEIKLALGNSSPDHRFLWLRILDASSNQDVSINYNFCEIMYTLKSSSGELKEDGGVPNAVYFPSIELSNSGVRFELGDSIELSISVIHKKFGLVKKLPSTTLVIENLWR